MSQIGCLGDIAFVVSGSTVKTLDELKWSGSARYVTHNRVGSNALTEFVGLDPDKITFEIMLSAYLGAEPMSDLNKLWQYERSGTAVPFVLGDKGYGKYRWNVLSHEAKASTYDGHGNITGMTVSVSLQEYLKK